jgi:hypothetical protein
VARNYEKSLRRKTDFTSAFKSIGTIKPSRENILLPFFRNIWLSSRIPLRQEGRYGQSSPNVEGECDGRFDAARRATNEADGEIVWS